MSFPTFAPFDPFVSADDDLARRTTAYLASRGFRSFRALRISAESGVIRLSGRLSSYYEKQVAQESCRRVAGVRRVVDAIEVSPTSLRLSANVRLSSVA